MPLKKFMRILGVVLIAVILGLVTYFVLLSIAFDEFTKDLKESSIYGRDLIRTEVGDEFKIEYSTDSFPKFSTSVFIYNKNHKFHEGSYGFVDNINFYSIKDDYRRPEFKLFVDNEKLRVYEIIIKKENGKELRREYIYRNPYSSYTRIDKDELDFWIKYYNPINFSVKTDNVLYQ